MRLLIVGSRYLVGRRVAERLRGAHTVAPLIDLPRGLTLMGEPRG